MFKKSRKKMATIFLNGFFFAVLAKNRFYCVGKSIEIDLNRFFRHLNRFKISKKLDLFRFKMDLSEILMDFSEIRMDFSEYENPSKSILNRFFRHLSFLDT